MNAFAQPSPAPVAGPQLDNRRVLAAIVDLVVIFAGSFALGTIVGLVNGGSAEWTGQMQLITVAWALYYYFAFESGDGQTLGKKLLKIRVIRADGTPAGMREIAVRTVLRVIDGLFMYLVGLIVMLATGQRRQRLGDLAAGTVVADATATASPATAATAAPPAAATPAGLDDPELPADAEPREKTPVDIGQPLEGLTPLQPAATPEVSDFQPFSPQADETEDAEQPQAADEPQSFDEPETIDEPESFDEPETFEEPQDFGESAPPVEIDTPAEPEAVEGPHAFGDREPSVELDTPAEPETFDTPQSFDSPSFETPAEEPAAEEPPSFETPAAPGSEEPAEQPSLSDDSLIVEAGRTEWPNMYATRASRAYEAEVELSPQPQEPHIDEPVEDLQANAARAADQPQTEVGSTVPGLPGSPVEEPASDEAPAAEAAEDEPAAEEEITFKPIETVSAIDLVMGDQAAQSDSSPDDSSDEAADSGDQPDSSDEPDSGDDHPAGP